MIRGSQAITAIFKDDTPKPRLVKGNYTFERDVLLAYRFYWYYAIKGMNYEKTVAELEREFFISQRTITDKLTEHQPLLKDIKNNNITTKQLAKRYPWFMWN